MTNLYIPKTIKVGFTKREDTFTQKLAFIIYYDDKGVLRQEKSWDGWCDKSFEPIEFENPPQNGFILNKGVKRSGHWGSGRSVIRVYDPRDFEFEITVDNLMGILMHSDVSKRDIMESCVFAWAGKDLVLLPTNSEEYQKSVEYTEKQGKKISAKQFVPGYLFKQKKHEELLTYIGYFPWFEWQQVYPTPYEGKKIHALTGKKHVFFDGEKYLTKTAADLSSIEQNTAVENIAQLIENFLNSHHGQTVVGVSVLPGTNKDKHFFKHENSNLLTMAYYPHHNNMLSFYTKFYIKDSDKSIDLVNSREDKYNLQELQEKVKLLAEDAVPQVLMEHGWGNLYYKLQNGLLSVADKEMLY